MKTWTQLLGNDTRNCLVDGRYISRRTGPDQYVRLWSFDTHQQALDVMQSWIDEVRAR